GGWRRPPLWVRLIFPAARRCGVPRHSAAPAIRTICRCSEDGRRRTEDGDSRNLRYLRRTWSNCLWLRASRIRPPPPLRGRDGEGGGYLILQSLYPPPVSRALRARRPPPQGGR